MEQWYEELDFEENPFNTNPSNFLKNIVGREDVIDELLYRIRAGSMVFVEGEDGIGKTSLLKLMIKRFRGKGKVIYVNCEKLEDELNIEELLVKRNGFLKGMLLKTYPRNMILLLDNVSKLSHLNTERIKYFFDQGYLKSVVFTGDNYDKMNFSESLSQRISKVIRLERLEDYQAVDMVRERIGDTKFFSDEVIEKIAELSGYNPKKILKNSEEVAEFIINVDEDAATVEHVAQVLTKKTDSKDQQPKEESPSDKEKKEGDDSEEMPEKNVDEAKFEEEEAEKQKRLDGQQEPSEEEPEDEPEEEPEEEPEDESLKEEPEEEPLKEEPEDEKKSSEKKKDGQAAPEEEISPEIKEVEDFESTKLDVEDIEKDEKKKSLEDEDELFQEEKAFDETEDDNLPEKEKKTSKNSTSDFDDEDVFDEKKEKLSEADSDDFFDDDFDDDSEESEDKKKKGVDDDE